jgi:hypothetical protein
MNILKWSDVEDYIVLSKIDSTISTSSPICEFLNLLDSYFPETLEKEIPYINNNITICIKTFLLGYKGIPDGYHILYNHIVASEIAIKSIEIFEICINNRMNFKDDLIKIIAKYLVAKYHSDNNPIISARYTIL